MTKKVNLAAQTNLSRPAIFIDRDGVLIVDQHYISAPADVVLIPGACEGLLAAQAAGYLLIVVTNQSGIGRGFFTEDDYHKVMDRLADLLSAGGVYLDGIFYCPHSPEANCSCRKPRSGLLDEASTVYNWDASRSWVIGDKMSDISLARNCNLGGILVETGHGLEEQASVKKKYGNDSRVVFAADLKRAIALILGHETQEDNY